jgi:hypothetical protein
MIRASAGSGGYLMRHDQNRSRVPSAVIARNRVNASDFSLRLWNDASEAFVRFTDHPPTDELGRPAFATVEASLRQYVTLISELKPRSVLAG